jgi:hypothetical protein
MADHYHYCDECHDRWSHVDDACGPEMVWLHELWDKRHDAYYRWTSPEFDSFSYECPQHAGSQEVSG